MITLLVLAVAPAVAVTTAEAGPERLVLDGEFEVTRLYTADQWQSAGRWDRGEVRWPEGVGDDALYGVAGFDDRPVPCVVEGAGEALHVRVDLDGDADMTGGGRRVALGEPEPEGALRWAVVEAGDHRLRLGVMVDGDGRVVQGHRIEDGRFVPGGLFWSDRTRRDGRITVGDREVRFTLLGRGGRYDVDGSAVAFDLDGDGEARTDAFADDHHGIDLPGVWIDGRGFRFRVAPDGSRLTLEPCAAPDCPRRPRIDRGRPAPSFTVLDLDGRAWHAEALRGRPVLLQFWASSCEPCIRRLPDVRRIADRYGPDRLQVLGLNAVDTRETMRRYATELGWGGPQAAIAADGPLASAYRLQGVPRYVLIGADGRIVEPDAGLEAIETHLAGRNDADEVDEGGGGR